MRKHGQQAEAKACYESLVRTNSPISAPKATGGWSSMTRPTNEFRIATAQPDSDPLYKVRWGMLLHQRFNNTDAVGLFQEALQRDPKNAQAYLGLAIVSADGFDGKATDYVSRALVLDPKLVEAHEFAANLPWKMRIQNTPSPRPMRHSAYRPTRLNAMAIHAAVELLADRSPDPWLDKIRKVNPGYGGATPSWLIILCSTAAMKMRSPTTARRSRPIPSYWSARSQLGVGLMRLGQEDEPLKQLEMCYNNGYRDAETVNSLRCWIATRTSSPTKRTGPS